MQDKNSIEIFIPNIPSPLSIDIENYDLFKAFAWNYSRINKNLGYRKGIKIFYIHRIILNAKPWDYVDHINGNRMDNRKINLRLCTNSQNNANKGKIKRVCASKFKGVHWHKGAGKWCAQIRKDNKNIYGGLFDLEIDAAKKANELIQEHHKDFGVINVL